MNEDQGMNEGMFLQNELNGEYNPAIESFTNNTLNDIEQAKEALYKLKNFQLLQFELDAIMNALSVTEKAVVSPMGEDELVNDDVNFKQIEVSTIRGKTREELTGRLIQLLQIIPTLG
jgi:hypothetical protein